MPPGGPLPPSQSYGPIARPHAPARAHPAPPRLGRIRRLLGRVPAPFPAIGERNVHRARGGGLGAKTSHPRVQASDDTAGERLELVQVIRESAVRERDAVVDVELFASPAAAFGLSTRPSSRSGRACERSVTES